MQIRLQTNGTALAVTESKYALTAGLAGIAEAVFTTDALWHGLALTAVFTRGGRTVLMPLANGRCRIPHEMTAESGMFFVGLLGSDGVRSLPSVLASVRVYAATPTDGERAENYTPSLYEQFAARFGRIENMTVRAADGETASVTAREADGALCLDFTLPRGKAGYTPQRGIDYWTEEDVAAVRGYVDDAILGGAW